MLYEVITETQNKEPQNQAQVEAKTKIKPTPVTPKESAPVQSSAQSSFVKETPQATTSTEARITSYNVCYTKLLRKLRIAIRFFI